VCPTTSCRQPLPLSRLTPLLLAPRRQTPPAVLTFQVPGHLAGRLISLQPLDDATPRLQGSVYVHQQGQVLLEFSHRLAPVWMKEASRQLSWSWIWQRHKGS